MTYNIPVLQYKATLGRDIYHKQVNRLCSIHMRECIQHSIRLYTMSDIAYQLSLTIVAALYAVVCSVAGLRALGFNHSSISASVVPRWWHKLRFQSHRSPAQSRSTHPIHSPTKSMHTITVHSIHTTVCFAGRSYCKICEGSALSGVICMDM